MRSSRTLETVICFICLFLLLSPLQFLCVVVTGELGDPFSTLPSIMEHTNGTHSSAPSSFWGPNYRTPYPTNTWWMNLVLAKGDHPIVTYPYMIRLGASRFNLCYPGKETSKSHVSSAMVDNLSLGAIQALEHHTVSSHDDLSVTVQFNAIGSVSDSVMKSAIVRGQAYHTVQYSGLNPTISTVHPILNISSLSGTKVKISLANGQTWIIYASSPIVFTRSNNTLISQQSFTGYLRAAVVLNPSTMEQVFDECRAAVPMGGTVTYRVDNDVALIKFNWRRVGSGPLLMFALPHHQDVLQNARSASPAIVYRSIKGPMMGIIGDSWIMKEHLVTDIGFHARYEIVSDASARESILSALIKDQDSYPEPTDPYFGGKAVARLGRLALIADELGQVSIAAKIRSNMKKYFDQWLGETVTSENKFVYERTYGGLVSKKSVGSSEADFGQYFYNDHHFHYGYFVYAAACIIKKDQAWGMANKQKIYEIVRDYGNPSNLDPSFPTLRNKDWFVGHSFAAGLFTFEYSRNQESTSEAVNAYYAMYLLGLVFNDSNMFNMGRILLQTEVRSSQKYWQITSESNIYDQPFCNNKVVGILWETRADYSTFFGENVEFIHGIQMLPITPISEDLLPASWIQESYQVFKSTYDTASQGWLGILFSAQAQFDLSGASPRILSLTAYDDGNTRTNTLYWLYTRPNGQPKRRYPFADIDRP